MAATDVSLNSLTAGDLMTREIMTIPAGMPLRDAARELARLGVHGAPVVDGEHRMVGVLSVSDLARWAARQAGTPPPRACPYQEPLREPGGRETTLCLLGPGACALQRFQERAGGRLVVTCADAHGICTDWQVVDVDSLPADDVRHCMTTDPLTVAADAPLPELARRMLARKVARVIVVDPDGRPVGIVSTTDILRALAGVAGGEPA